LAVITTVSIPAGFTASGLPVGLQVTGKPFDEATVLRVAHAFERATEYQTQVVELTSGQNQDVEIELLEQYNKKQPHRLAIGNSPA